MGYFTVCQLKPMHKLVFISSFNWRMGLCVFSCDLWFYLFFYSILHWLFTLYDCCNEVRYPTLPYISILDYRDHDKDCDYDYDYIILRQKFTFTCYYLHCIDFHCSIACHISLWKYCTYQKVSEGYYSSSYWYIHA